MSEQCAAPWCGKPADVRDGDVPLCAGDWLVTKGHRPRAIEQGGKG